MSKVASIKDYSLTGPECEKARADGIVGTDWYRCAIPRKQLKELMKRSNGPALRDTAIWFLSLTVSGVGAYLSLGSLWSIPFFLAYGVLYGSVSDSRWHECGHGTAFKTRWMNDTVYYLSCLMMLREPVVWRWSHTRHHTDTLIVGCDPEIASPRPPSVLAIILNMVSILNALSFFRKIIIRATGRLMPDEKLFIPPTEHSKIFWLARIFLLIFVALTVWCAVVHSIVPAMFIGLPSLYGAWLGVVFGLTQHAGLDENILDHRQNCRTVYMNATLRFLYWNMNYHIEHHMFPMVPYHALPRLHEAIKADCPPPYLGLTDAYQEIIPALIQQRKDLSYYVRRPVPNSDGSQGRLPKCSLWPCVGSHYLGMSFIIMPDFMAERHAG